MTTEGLNRAEVGEVAARKPKGQGGSARAKGKGKPVTTRVFRPGGGYRLTVERSQGIVDGVLCEMFRSLFKSLEAEGDAQAAEMDDGDGRPFA